jgi:hypothetical protein
MRNLFILGSGRSGTSLAAGLLAINDPFYGPILIGGSDRNPKGFFESSLINGINERIIARSERFPRLPYRVCLRLPDSLKYYLSPPPGWVAELVKPETLYASRRDRRQIAALTAKKPFVFKDPRLSYTFPLWRRHSPDAKYLCIFRDPLVTARSIVDFFEKDRNAPGRRYINSDRALRSWECQYRYILQDERLSSDALFCHYEQLKTTEKQAEIADFAEANIDASFYSQRLNRTHEKGSLPRSVSEVYGLLCEKASYPHATG